MNSKDKRYDWYCLIEYINSIPNADNQTNIPRTINNNYGYITPTCIRNNIRRYMEELGENVFVGKNKLYTGKNNKLDYLEYIDNRLFGYVKDKSCEENGGCIYVSGARSLDPVTVYKESLIRVAHDKILNQSTFGERYYIERGVYECWAHYFPELSDKYNVTDKDIDIFEEAFKHCMRYNVSSTRKIVNLLLVCKIIHNNRLGNILDYRKAGEILRNGINKINEMNELNELKNVKIEVLVNTTNL